MILVDGRSGLLVPILEQMVMQQHRSNFMLNFMVRVGYLHARQDGRKETQDVKSK